MPVVASTMLADQPVNEPEPDPPEAPALWYFTGVFDFPWAPDAVGRWLTLTLFALVSNCVATVALHSLPTLSGDHNYGSAIMTPFVIALAAIVGLLMMAFASGCVVTIVRDTAAGIDEITD